MDDAPPEYDGPPDDYGPDDFAPSDFAPAARRAKPSGPSKGRVPPHNLAAEESLLGAMLLSRTAIDIASESVAPSDFYKPAHGHIYEAITSLSARGEPVDPVNVADELARHDPPDAA